jgi:glycosyltransferase involved in cell wall biosynthesis
MNRGAQPLVSVVTPVYNGEKYLAECIESVLRQTYRHWEYVIVDNCSTDRSLNIAERYAQLDNRVHVCSNPRLVSVWQNHHIGFREMARQSKYCKVVHADDWLFADCISQMVELAEAHPSVGMVSAYRLDGEWVDLGGLPYPSTIVPGREICRRTLLRWAYVFGSPSSLLVRSECIRGRESSFYDEVRFPRHADLAACYETLREWDFGFVHQVLTYTRRPSEALTSFNRMVNSHLAEGVAMLEKYGPIYLEAVEYERSLERWMKGYRQFLGRSLMRRRGKPFWDYHVAMLGNLGCSFSRLRLLGALLSGALGTVVSPFTAVRRMLAFGRSPARKP